MVWNFCHIPYNNPNEKSNIPHSQRCLLKSKQEKINSFATSWKNYTYLLLHVCIVKTNRCHWLVSNLIYSLILNISAQLPEVHFSSYQSLHSLSRPKIFFSFLSLLISVVFDNSVWKSFLISRSIEIPECTLSHYSLGPRATFLHRVNQTPCSFIHFCSYSMVEVHTYYQQ